jgi:hypothetical protein
MAPGPLPPEVETEGSRRLGIEDTLKGQAEELFNFGSVGSRRRRGMDAELALDKGIVVGRRVEIPRSRSAWHPTPSDTLTWSTSRLNIIAATFNSW